MKGGENKMKKAVCLIFVLLVLNLFSSGHAQENDVIAFKNLEKVSLVTEIDKNEKSVDINKDGIQKSFFVMLKSKIPELEIIDYNPPYVSTIKIKIVAFDQGKLFQTSHIKGYVGTIHLSLTRPVLLFDDPTLTDGTVWIESYTFWGSGDPTSHIKKTFDDLLNGFAYNYFQAKKLPKGETQ